MKMKKCGERGSALIQFALVLPMMIYILAIVFDIGAAVSAKVNLQHLASELQKVTVYSEQGAATGGITGTGNSIYFRDRVLEEHRSLNKDKLDIKITETEPEIREFENHHYWAVNRSYVSTINTNKVKYVTVALEYPHEYKMMTTRAMFGKEVVLKESFTNLVFIETDKAW